MKVICICGGIGSGKSVVSRILRLNGHPVYDCDQEAKSLMQNGVALRKAISGLLGSEVYAGETGLLNREKVAELIFNDSELLGKLNRIVHKAVRDDIQGRIQGCDKGCFFIESAIPATSGLLKDCDEVWFVTADEEVRIRRAVERQIACEVSGETRERGEVERKIRRRVEIQRDEERKIRESGVKRVEILNDGHSLLRELDRLIPGHKN